jgi:putative transposase
MYESFSSWIALLQDKIRDIIECSNLDDHTKHVLHRINIRKAWYKNDFKLLWSVNKDKNGNEILISADKNSENTVSASVTYFEHKLMLHIIKHARKSCSRPDLRFIRTIKMDAKIAQLETGNNSFEYWLKLSTLEKNKPIYLPLKNNSWFKKKLEEGKLCNHVQVSFDEDYSTITIAPVIEINKTEMRTEGEIIGLDWGVTALFGTSEGQLLGMRMLSKLKLLDKQLMVLQAELQRNNQVLNKNKRYKTLQRQISSYVKNETGRLLNSLAENNNISEIVVEKLDFRHISLSKTINRIISRAGRKAVESKLSRLNETKGIKITHVNSAYTSRQCSRCGYTDKKNRKSQSVFKCKCCGYTGNADINASRNIKERRSFLISADGANKTVRKNLYNRLFEEHCLICPTGKHCTAVENIGLTGNQFLVKCG